MMPMVPVKALSHVLRAAVYFFLLCNAVVLLLLPFLLADSYSPPNGTAVPLRWPSEVSPALEGEFTLSLCVFYVCGLASLSLLRQGGLVLRNLSRGRPFRMQNANAMRRASYSCFVIAGAALVRQMVWSLQGAFWWSLGHYNLLFIPFFLLAGLFCLLVAELFRQAAVLCEDASLVI